MIERTRRIARGGAVVAPIVVAAVLSLLREFLASLTGAAGPADLRAGR